MSSDTPATPLEKFLEKLEIDPLLHASLHQKRITTIRKLFQLTPSYIDTNIEPTLSYDTAELDLVYIKRLIPAHHLRMKTTKAFPSYDTMPIEEIDTMISEFEAQDLESASDASARHSTIPHSTEGSSSHKTTTKRYLDAYNDCTFPQVPVGAKAMKDFKIAFINVSRSMKLDYLFEPDYVPPIEGDTSYSSFIEDNTFLFSALIKVTTKHEGQNLINTDQFMNNGIAAYEHLLQWYDVEGTEECITAVSFEKLYSLRLAKIHKGACNTFISNFAYHLNILNERKVPLHDSLARDLFLNNITHDEYKATKNQLRLRGDTVDLQTCYKEIKSLSSQIEEGPKQVRSRIRKARAGGDNNNNKPTQFNGKPLDEYGFFKNTSDFNALSKDQKQSYFKKKSQWLEKNLIKKKQTTDPSPTPAKGSANVRSMQAGLQSLQQALTSPTNEEGNKDNDEVQSIVSELTSTEKDNMSKIVRLLNSSINITRTFRHDIRAINRVQAGEHIYATIDGGADTCLLGSSFRFFEYTGRSANVASFDDTLHVKDLRIGSGVTAYDHPDGTTYLIMIHEAIDHTSQHNSIISVGQVRFSGVDLCDRHPKFRVNNLPGSFRLKHQGVEAPFIMEKGLVSLRIRTPTDHEIDTCPVLEITSDSPWDPSVLSGDDFTPGVDTTVQVMREPVADAIHHALNIRRLRGDFGTPTYDPVYDSLDSFVFNQVDPSIATGPNFNDLDTVYKFEEYISTLSNNNKLTRNDQPPDWDHVQKCMGWFPLDVLKRTFAATTQLAKISALPYRDHFKSRNPQLNKRRLPEPYATDTWFASETALNGETCVQLFVGLISFLVFPFGMKTESEGPSKLKTFVRQIGAPFSLMNDNSKMQTGSRWMDICNEYNIGTSTTEPRHPWQNRAERKIGTVKKAVNRLMDRTNSPGCLWFQCTVFVCMLLNVLANPQLNWRTPMEKGLGVTPDISQFLQFQWYEPVLFLDDNGTFPSTAERKGYWCGPTENVGDAMTYWILTEDTNQLIARSNVRSALPDSSKTSNIPVNFRAFFSSDLEGSELKDELQSAFDQEDSVSSNDDDSSNTDNNDGDSTDNPRFTSFNEMVAKLTGKDFSPIIDPHDLVGYSFVTEHDDIHQRATVSNVDTELDKVTLTFMNGSEEIMEYNDLINLINAKHEDGNGLHSYNAILDHRKKRGKLEVQIQWDDGDVTWEPLKEMKLADMVTLAKYAHDHNLVDQPGWKWAKTKTKNPQKFMRLAKIFKSQVNPPSPRYKFGVRVPRNRQEALVIDKINGNNLWEEAIEKEINQLLFYDTFDIKGTGEKAPDGYQKIPGFLVFDVKHDLRRKARFVAGGHVTNPPREEVYSGVVDHESVRIAMFLAAHNDLDILATDVGNAYLHGVTREKVYIIAGPEFGEHEGKVLVVVKALYGLVSSAARWHEALSSTLRDMGFVPSKADPDMWMKDVGTHYEYILVYSDDLLLISKSPKHLLEQLSNKYKLKGISFPDYYLGGDFARTTNSNGEKVSYLSAKTYVKNVCTKIESTFDIKLKPMNVPFDPSYHPEIDDTPLLGNQEISKYRMLIGSAIWATALGRHDILYATGTLARYNAFPREGHLHAALRLFGYLKNNPKACTVFDTTEPDLSKYSKVSHNWTELYPGAKEELPDDIPLPKMKPITILAYFDASHAPCLITRRSVTGIALLLNNTLIRCTSKRQNTVETSTYGAELVAGRLCVEQVMDLRYKLRMLGVPINDASIVLGDNQSTITSATIPSSNLKKKHNAIAYHRIREAVAAGIVNLFHVPSEDNLADAFTKPLGGHKLRGLFQRFLFRSPQA